MCHGYNHCALIGFRWGIGITICNGILGIVRFEKEKWENWKKKFFGNETIQWSQKYLYFE